MKQKIIEAIRKGHKYDESITAYIVGKPVCRIWDYEDHKTFKEVFSCLAEMKKEGTIKSKNMGYHDYIFNLAGE